MPGISGRVWRQRTLSARIVALADADDAMATDRPYKKALLLEECGHVVPPRLPFEP